MVESKLSNVSIVATIANHEWLKIVNYCLVAYFDMAESVEIYCEPTTRLKITAVLEVSLLTHLFILFVFRVL